MEPDQAQQLAQAQEQLRVLARDVNTMYQAERARARELEAALAALQDNYLATVRTLAFIVEAKDSSTREHLERTHDYARALARVVTGEEVGHELSYGFLLHDVGKVGIPESILRKAGPLDAGEWRFVRAHTIIGERILTAAPVLRRVATLVRSSHERWDGLGYPDGLAGEEIPLGARIIAVCDAYHAMTSDRPYRRAMTTAQAIGELRRHAGTQFDPGVVEVLLEVLEDHEQAPASAA